MRRLLLALLLACALPAQGAVITAASCSNANVQTAITNASAGDTVVIPTGNCTWTGAVTNSKRLIIHGSGNSTSGTVITMSNSNNLTFTNNGSDVFTLRNMRVLGVAGTNGLIRVSGTVDGFRITGNYFQWTSDGNAPDGMIYVSGNNTKGVIDNNTFAPTSAQTFRSAIHIEDAAGTVAAYTRPSMLGTDDTVVIEDNIFTVPTYSGSTHAVYAQTGGSYAFRYNTITNWGIDMHGPCSWWGGREFEVYENDWIASGSSIFSIGIFRGNTGVFYNNRMTTNGNSVGNQRIRMQEVDDNGTCATSIYGASCSGHSCTYPWNHQLGRGQNNQLDPIYFWNNRKDGGVITTVVQGGNSCPCHGSNDINFYAQQNRDWYDSASTAKPGYAQLEYPHPLVQASPVITATSCSSANVQAAINVALPGDTVALPAPCSATWNISSISISAKGITLDGNDADITAQIPSAHFEAPIQASTHATELTRITEINFSGGAAIEMSTSDSDTSAALFRIDHNTFSNSDFVQIYVTGAGHGLIDNNTFTWSGNAEVIHTQAYGAGDTTGWSNDVYPGTDRATYIEDNLFDNQAEPNFLGGKTAAFYGSRNVIRYNTYNAATVDQHGTATNVGARWWEVYKNAFTDSTTNVSINFQMRAGSGYMFDNTAVSGPGGRTMTLWEEDAGYPQAFQVGRGKCFQAPCDVGSNQALEPIYIWNKSVNNPFGVAESSANQIVANRDYYIQGASFNGTSGVGVGTRASRPATCTAQVGYWSTDQGGDWDTTHGGANDGCLDKCIGGTWTNCAYTPYTYPHPLQGLGEEPSAPDPPQNFRITSVMSWLLAAGIGLLLVGGMHYVQRSVARGRGDSGDGASRPAFADGARRAG